MTNYSDFKLLNRKVIDALNQLPEKKVFFCALSYLVGFRKTEVQYCVQKRIGGESKWSAKALIRYAVSNILTFSSVPLKGMLFVGAALLFAAFVLGVTAVVQRIMGLAMSGYTALFSLLLLSNSFIVDCICVLTYYVVRIFGEGKGSPRYIITEESSDRK